MIRHAEKIVLAIAVTVSACGDGGEAIGPPAAPNVTGAWSFTISNLTTGGLGFSCSAGGTMQLTQSGSSFDGTYHLSSFRCTNGFSSGPGDGSVVNGSVYASDSVHFHFDDEDLDQHGVISAGGRAMSGRSTWVASDGGSPVVVTGSWAAHR